MAYEKQIWQSGDVITAAKMNHIEDGIAASGYESTVWSTGDVITAAKMNKIEEALANIIIPSGTISITTNGTYDVSEKASAVVNVSSIFTKKVNITNNLEGGYLTLNWFPSIKDIASYEGGVDIAAKATKEFTVGETRSGGTVSANIYVCGKFRWGQAPSLKIPTGKKVSVTTTSGTVIQSDITNEAGLFYEGFVYVNNAQNNATLTFNFIDA